MGNLINIEMIIVGLNIAAPIVLGSVISSWINRKISSYLLNRANWLGEGSIVKITTSIASFICEVKKIGRYNITLHSIETDENLMFKIPITNALKRDWVVVQKR